KNFLMTLKRYKVASLLNVLGLTLAFVAFYIIASQVWFTLTYNHSLKDAGRTYLISPNFGGENSEMRWTSNSPGNLAYMAAEHFPDAEEVASYAPYPGINRIWVKQNEYHFEPFNDFVYEATANVPDFFGFECLAGNFAELKKTNTVIMSRSEAEKLSVSVGDVIYLEGGKWFDDGKPTHPQTIVAIYEDMPKNSVFAHWDIVRNDEGVYTLGNNNWNYTNYVRMRKGADLDTYIEIFKKAYADWFLGMAQEWIAEDPEEEELIKEEIEKGAHILATRLVPVNKMYYTDFSDAYNFQTGKKSTPIILSSIAFIIVLIAFINFINFFFALVPVRMRTVNICKVFGASQATLRWNFLFEAIGLVLISMVLMLYLMIVIQDSFIMNYSICSLSLSDNIPVIIMVVVLMVLLAVLAALYPAFYITRFNASMGVKGGFAQSATGRRLRSVMVGVQFSVAMILIIVTAVFWMQYRYMINYDLGFDRENVVTFASWDLGTRHETVVDRLQQHPDAEDVTSSMINLFYCNQTWGREYEGKEYMMRANGVRWNFLDFFGFEVVEGDGFTSSSAERNEIVMLQSMHRDIGLPVGYKESDWLTYVGVVKDVRLSSLSQNNDYHAFYCVGADTRMSHFYIRLRAGADVKAFAEYVNKISEELAPAADKPELRFLEFWVEHLYEQTKKDMVLIGLFAVLAIVIALMGVFGIVMFETQHRRSEIAVRKVYGATSNQMIVLFNLRYVRIVLLCFIVAAPVAWYIASHWLGQFVNRITLPWWMFLVVLAIIMSITIAIVSVRSWAAANANPSEELNQE
ncbi:MAG: ABC transporter permease, partial [Bacteroidales bacterium]|nr:ABC transporter permease [Bacteroidales bacterium]